MPDFLSRTTAILSRIGTVLQRDATLPDRQGRYDRLIDAANRLPRPVLVYGAVALFALALIRPDLFDRGMASLDRMPEELWWLVGAILAGHFGARETHYLRGRDDRKAPPSDVPITTQGPAEKPSPSALD